MVENNWTKLMKRVKTNREKRNNEHKLNMDLCLLEMENVYEAKQSNINIKAVDSIQVKLRVLEDLIEVYQRKYSTEIDGVDYYHLIIMGKLILNLYENK